MRVLPSYSARVRHTVRCVVVSRHAVHVNGAADGTSCVRVRGAVLPAVGSMLAAAVGAGGNCGGEGFTGGVGARRFHGIRILQIGVRVLHAWGGVACRGRVKRRAMLFAIEHRRDHVLLCCYDRWLACAPQSLHSRPASTALSQVPRVP